MVLPQKHVDAQLTAAHARREQGRGMQKEEFKIMGGGRHVPPSRYERYTSFYYRPADLEFQVSDARVPKEAGGDATWRVRWEIGPADSRSRVDQEYSRFGEVVRVFQMWAFALPEREIPDFWQQISDDPRFALLSVSDCDNTPLTEDEQRQIVGALKELPLRAESSLHVSAEQVAELEERVEQLADAARRVGRVDWRNLLAGALLTAALPPDAIRGAAGALVSSVGHVFGVSIPQLPP